jgi:hypothetical protein
MLAPLPRPRGPLTYALLDAWAQGRRAPATPDLAEHPEIDARVDDDLHLALWCCYQLHYGGFDGVPHDLEWDPELLRFRGALEQAFERALRAEHEADPLPDDPVAALRIIGERAGPPLARTIGDRGTRWQVQEFVIHRSAYQLKEADGHTFGIPRLHGRTKSAVVEIQSDEYGNGRPGESHAELFASAMAELGLDARFGALVDALPGVTLATDNLVSMLGLHERLRGALVGHLAHFEMSSTGPMANYLRAADRLGLPHLARFYEVHVEVDDHHGALALAGAVEPLIDAEPELAADVVFGAASLHRAEARFARHLLHRWAVGSSSLRSEPAPADRDDEHAMVS